MKYVIPALVQKLQSLVADERRTAVEFLVHLAVAETRKIPLDLGYPSTWEFLTGRLGLPESSARRRIIASRLLSRFPIVAGYLDSGRLNLTTLCELRHVLEDDNVEQVLERASGLSTAAVMTLVASLRTPANQAPLPSVATPLAAAAAASGVTTEQPTPPTPPTPPSDDASRPDYERLQLIVTREFVDDLEQVKALLSHRIVGDTCAAIHEALRIAKVLLRKKKLGGGRKRPPPKEGSRNVPTAVKVAVDERDGGKCTFVGKDGHVCGSMFQVQFQHIQPYARSGAATVENVTQFCKRHNALAAERDFGKEHIERRRIESDVVSALVNMGFSRKDALQAVAKVSALAPSGSSIPDLLRAALRALSAHA